MKWYLLSLALFSAANAAKISTLTLENDIEDIYNAIPHQKFFDLTDKYLKEDKEFANAVAFLQSKEWKKLVESFLARPEVKELLDFLENAKLPVRKHIKKVEELIKRADTSKADGQTKGSFKKFLQEAEKIFTVEELIVVIRKKAMQSADLRQFLATMESKEALLIFDKVIKLPETSEMISQLIERGFNTAEMNKKSIA